MSLVLPSPERKDCVRSYRFSERARILRTLQSVSGFVPEKNQLVMYSVSNASKSCSRPCKYISLGARLFSGMPPSPGAP